MKAKNSENPYSQRDFGKSLSTIWMPHRHSKWVLISSLTCPIKSSLIITILTTTENKSVLQLNHLHWIFPKNLKIYPQILTGALRMELPLSRIRVIVEAAGLSQLLVLLNHISWLNMESPETSLNSNLLIVLATMITMVAMAVFHHTPLSTSRTMVV